MSFGDYFSSIVGSTKRSVDFDRTEFFKFVEDFEPFCLNADKYFDKIPYHDVWPKHLPNLEKKFEYFVTTKLLPIKSDDVYCDLASCLSLFPEYIRSRTGATVYRQDILYQKGIHGNSIGGDAGSLCVADGSFTALTLHCSLEHFEGNSDIRMMMEILRVLRSGGSLLILPFYCGLSAEEVLLENEPPGAQFRRYYSPETFRDRFENSLLNVELTFFEVSNFKEIDESLYCQNVLRMTRK